MSQRSSSLPESSAPIANANGTVSPTYPRYRSGGWASMYGFWRLGVMPAPSAGAACVANGLATATSRNAKNVDTAPNTGTTQTMRSRAHARFTVTAAAPNPVRTSSQRRSEPSCPPQKAESV